MKELAFASIKILSEKLARKECSVQELRDFFYNRFERYDTKLGSALELFDKNSVMPQKNQGTLFGIPGLIKDNICQKGRALTCASRILEGFTAPYDATAITRLKNQGALLIGRANMDEFAMGSSTETSAFKKTVNPWNAACVPGGSSGGSAAAVAAGLVPWALGSETGGSVRQPAALCGIVGIKPTYGLVSRYGLVAYCSSFDQIGVVTRTVSDNALILSVMAGRDAMDSTTVHHDIATDYTVRLEKNIKKNLKIGVIDNAFNIEGMGKSSRSLFENSLKEFEKLGAEIVHLSLPTMDYGAAVYFMLSRAEAASNLARFDGVRYGFRASDIHDLTDLYFKTRGEGFGQEVKRRIFIGNYVLSAGHADQYYQSAKKVQAIMRAEFVEAFKKVDLLYAPTSPAPAFKFGAFADNHLEMDLQDYFTAPANIVGVPAISVPCGFVNNMPLGFQLIGPDFSEHLLYQVAHAYEQATPWHTMHPRGFEE